MEKEKKNLVVTISVAIMANAPKTVHVNRKNLFRGMQNQSSFYKRAQFLDCSIVFVCVV